MEVLSVETSTIKVPSHTEGWGGPTLQSIYAYVAQMNSKIDAKHTVVVDAKKWKIAA